MLRRTLALLSCLFVLVAACSDDTKPATSASSAAANGAASSAASSAAPRTLRVMVTNDDGVEAPGIDALVEALLDEPDTDVTVVAPAANQSGSGGKTSAAPPPASNATTMSGYPAVAVEGFPADAVVHGLTNVVEEQPDLVISGINSGQNIGPFIEISGTVGAAREAARRGVPALAVSAGLGDPVDFATAATLAMEWVREHRAALLQSHPAPTTIDNLNVPTCTTGSVRDEVEATPEPSAPGDVALGASDCTSTAPAPSGDVDAFVIGFATLSTLPLS
jgi:5'-nucleotidase